jgi:integrase
MARRIRYSELETWAARDRLKTRKSHFRALDPGRLALGYRRKRRAVPGVWLKRVYIGTDARGIGHYRTTIIGVADDYADADGINVFSFAQAQLRARDQVAPGSPITVREAVNAYIAFLRARGAPTNDTERRAALHILPQLGDVEVEKLTSLQIRHWLAVHANAPAYVRSKKGGERQVKAAPLGDPEVMRRRRSSANRVLTILKAALNHSFDEGRVASNSAWGRRVKPYRSVDAARLRFLTIAEAGRLINACDPEFQLLVRGALESGARYGELIALQAQDFNTDAGTLHIRRSKTGKDRHVILTREGSAFFAQLTAGLAGDALIFRRRDGSGWKQSQQGRPVREANTRARLKPPISFHTLRHTYASHCVMNGVPLMVVAKNLGHSSTTMIEKHYGHLAPSYISDAIRAGAPRYGVKIKSKITPLRGGVR